MKRSKICYDVYIAGAMHGREVGTVLAERRRASEYLKQYELSFYDPAADEGLEGLEDTTIIDAKPNEQLMRHYVKKDDRHVDQSRYLLVLTGDLSTSGTAWEMGRHFYRNGRPIVLVSPKRFNGRLVNFTSIKAYKICESLPEAVKFIYCDNKRRTK